MNDFVKELIERYPSLECCGGDVGNAIKELCACLGGGGRVFLCGNGGSAADATHIVGELVKGFKKKRPIDYQTAYQLKKVDPQSGEKLASGLQGGLCAHDLGENLSLVTAVSNDLGAELVYAQQVMAYGRAGDLLIGITTSGNAENVRLAAVTARAIGMSVIGLTGQSGGKLAQFSDICIKVPETETYKVQELHLPVYHCLCAATEAEFFEE